MCIFGQIYSCSVFTVVFRAIVYMCSPVVWACDNTHWLVLRDCRPVLFKRLGRKMLAPRFGGKHKPRGRVDLLARPVVV